MIVIMLCVHDTPESEPCHSPKGKKCSIWTVDSSQACQSPTVFSPKVKLGPGLWLRLGLGVC